MGRRSVRKKGLRFDVVCEYEPATSLPKLIIQSSTQIPKYKISEFMRREVVYSGDDVSLAIIRSSRS